MMKAAFTEIDTNYDISLRFCVENVRDFFERGDEQDSTRVVRATDTFGPGWHIKCKATNFDGENYLSCYLVAGSMGYPTPISFSFAGESSQGGIQYFKFSTTHTFTAFKGADWGWTKALSKLKGWDRYETLREENALYIRATIRAQVAAVYPDRCLDLSHDVITTERPTDVRFVVHASRDRAGELSKPRELFANKATIRRACPLLAKYIDNLDAAAAIAQELFGEAKRGPHQSTSSAIGQHDDNTSQADSDWDFDDEEQVEKAPHPHPTAEETEGRRDAGAVSDTESWEAGDMSPLDDTMSDWAFEETRPANEVVSIAPTTIAITGAALPTWEAFLFYIYTGVVAFGPLKSRGEATRTEFIADYRVHNPHRPAPCSCKSMYRIACILDLPGLKELALKELSSQLSKENIVTEIFTGFTAKHEEVMDLELRILKEHWAELKGTEQVSEVLKNVVRGKLPHAAAVMAELL
ncbi:uncharacterized protein C8Q71DRAFT_559595 [Rhodofomes roseus]|uniref:MATH domain-containing protein n=1 Tax=Rhodofomes roseus TaxID=34475 RepID=A0ABQ8KIG6_9APHY|nr:uncharacterized protein C8Q71DRAFT_559595 [Rhodofomes roseus]KAH9837754.1 hypothetical protein C8Q71DRAFT_559595 [Rhodofomes roseus]